MEIDISKVNIEQVRGHWEVYIDGKFFCSADTHLEAINEIFKEDA